MPGHLFAIPLILSLPSAIWAAGALRWLRRKECLVSGTPSVSVVVVGRNEAEFVEPCLKSILACDYPSDSCEIIFVDDHSTDGTLELARGIALLADGRLKVLSAPDQPESWGPKKRALAHAVEGVRGEILILTDADCVVPKLWIRSFTERFDEKTGVALGPALPPRTAGLLHRAYWIERLLVNLSMISATGFGSVASACGNAIAYRRSAWDSLAEFPYATLPSGDDDLVAQAVHARGWKVGFVATASALVRDLRPVTIRRELAAAVRHQSTTRYYPLQWRALYAWTIATNAAMVVLGLLACLRAEVLLLLIPAVALKLLIEVSCAAAVARRLGDDVSKFELAIGSLLLPVYLAVKPLLMLLPRFEWHGRQHFKGSGR